MQAFVSLLTQRVGKHLSALAREGRAS